MKSTVEQLTTQERTALALWYDSQTYKALRKLLELERANTATKLLLLNPNTEHHFISKHQGRAEMCKDLHQLLKSNYQEYVRTEESNKKKKAKG